MSSTPIRVFAISLTNLDARQYLVDLHNLIHWSEQCGFTGVLLFTGNDVCVEPWMAAAVVMSESETLSPIVAANPVYQHPFSAAKMVMSLTLLYGRKVYLNLVTGTALSYLSSIGDRVEHDDRYVRLVEYGSIVRQLLAAPRPVTYAGRFYQLTHAELLPGIPAEMAPEFLLAGQSPAAKATCETLGAIPMQMLQPSLQHAPARSRGISFGIVTRPTDGEAWEVARAIFPENLEDQGILDMAMQNTDAVWRRKLWDAARTCTEPTPGYWLGPFRNLQADTAYLVGDYQRVASVVAALVTRGVDTFILNIPARLDEFHHVSKALAVAGVAVRPASMSAALSR